MTKDKQSLTDLMLAMDVVDTLRHKKRLLDHELSAEERNQAFIKKIGILHSEQK